MASQLCSASRDRDRFEDDPYLGSLPHSFAACPRDLGILRSTGLIWYYLPTIIPHSEGRQAASCSEQWSDKAASGEFTSPDFYAAAGADKVGRRGCA